MQAGIAPATRRAYRADLGHFRAWGGDIPSRDAELAAYVAQHASGWSGCRVGLAPTGKRRLVTAHARFGHQPSGAEQLNGRPILVRCLHFRFQQGAGCGIIK